jgi:tetratricopeptide (TPR) repeat protein
MKPLVESFKPLTRKQILALPADQHGDYELLSVSGYFEEIDDRDREVAVYELILRSSQVYETVAYGELYLDVVNYYSWRKAFLRAIQWCYAMIAFGEQHDEGMNRLNHRMDLANIYFWREDFNVGLAMYARMLQDASETIWLYLGLGQELTKLGLSSLAADALEQALKQKAQMDRYKLKDLIEDLRDEAIEAASNDPSRVGEVDPEVLTNFQSALQLPM